MSEAARIVSEYHARRNKVVWNIMYGAVSVVIYYWHDQKICSCNNRYFFDCYCVTASYYHQKHNQSGVHNASYLSCYCYRHCYTTYL